MAKSNQIIQLEKLFKQYQPMLVAFAYKYVRSQEDAKGVVQEVFLAVWRNRDNLQFGANLKSYLFTATKNKSLNFLEKRRLKTISMERDSTEERPEIQIPDGNPDSFAQMETAELEAVIYGEVQKLPPKCREIFLLSRKENLSYKEIATKLEVSPKTVENQIGIALKRIRKRVFFYQNPNLGSGSFSLFLAFFFVLLFFYLGAT